LITLRCTSFGSFGSAPPICRHYVGQSSRAISRQLQLVIDGV